jgi:hypothetical protein
VAIFPFAGSSQVQTGHKGKRIIRVRVNHMILLIPFQEALEIEGYLKPSPRKGIIFLPGGSM